MQGITRGGDGEAQRPKSRDANQKIRSMKKLRLCKRAASDCKRRSPPHRRPDLSYLAAGTNLARSHESGNVMRGRISLLSTFRACLVWTSIEWLADGGVRIGALVRNSDLAYDDVDFARIVSIQSPRRCCRARPRNCATCRELPAATCCNARAVLISMTLGSACNQAASPGSGCDALRRREPSARRARLE